MKQQNKPCPFCGSKNLRMSKINSFDEWVFWVLCYDCKMNGPLAYSREEAWEKWNEQKSLNEKDAMIDWLADNARARWCAAPDGEPCRYPNDKCGTRCIECWIEVAREKVK